ncbi:MAG: hypothetical protein SGPRY_000261, partial [Prymnesium sp.]
MGYLRGGPGQVFQPRDPTPSAFPRRDMGITPAYPRIKRLRGGYGRHATLISPRGTLIGSSHDLLSGREEGLLLRNSTGTAKGISRQTQSSPAPGAEERRSSHALPSQRADPTEEEEFRRAAIEMQKIVRGRQARRSITLKQKREPVIPPALYSPPENAFEEYKAQLAGWCAQLQHNFERGMRCLFPQHYTFPQALARCIHKLAAGPSTRPRRKPSSRSSSRVLLSRRASQASRIASLTSRRPSIEPRISLRIEPETSLRIEPETSLRIEQGTLAHSVRRQCKNEPASVRSPAGATVKPTTSSRRSCTALGENHTPISKPVAATTVRRPTFEEARCSTTFAGVTLRPTWRESPRGAANQRSFQQDNGGRPFSREEKTESVKGSCSGGLYRSDSCKKTDSEHGRRRVSNREESPKPSASASLERRSSSRADAPPNAGSLEQRRSSSRVEVAPKAEAQSRERRSSSRRDATPNAEPQARGRRSSSRVDETAKAESESLERRSSSKVDVMPKLEPDRTERRSSSRVEASTKPEPAEDSTKCSANSTTVRSAEVPNSAMNRMNSKTRALSEAISRGHSHTEELKNEPRPADRSYSDSRGDNSTKGAGESNPGGLHYADSARNTEARNSSRGRADSIKNAGDAEGARAASCRADSKRKGSCGARDDSCGGAALATDV